MPQRPVRNLIHKQKILTAAAETTVAEATRLMKKRKLGAVMIVKEDGALLGIFTERDAVFRVLADGRDPTTTRLAEVMTAQPQTIAPDRPFGHALLMMFEGGFRHVPVVEKASPSAWCRPATPWAWNCRISNRKCSAARASARFSASPAPPGPPRQPGGPRRREC
jgi:hypothetical protein